MHSATATSKQAHVMYSVCSTSHLQRVFNIPLPAAGHCNSQYVERQLRKESTHNQVDDVMAHLVLERTGHKPNTHWFHRHESKHQQLQHIVQL